MMKQMIAGVLCYLVFIGVAERERQQVQATPAATAMATASTIASTTASTIEGHKVEVIAALAETSVPEAIRATLADEGLRVLGADGKTICEVWLRKEISAKATGTDGATFGQLIEGTLIGVINFPTKTNDYRGQAVKAGFYTLRYGLGPMDGAHLGVAPSRDFFMLGAPADDLDAKDVPPVELTKLSRKAVGTGHPAPLALTATTHADKDLPKVTVNEHEHVVLELKLPTKGASVSVGLIVVGKTAE